MEATDIRICYLDQQDLEAAIEEGGFREDLYYRLNALTIYVPPLRRRRVDIPFLAQHFAEELGEAQARRIVLDEDFLEALGRYEFPGNVRELRNAVERAIALAGPTPEAAYFVNVGLGRTMTGQDILEGRMIVEVGVAAVRPAEFIILKFSHKLQTS